MDNDGTLDAYFCDYGLPSYSKMGLKLRDVITGEELMAKDFISVPLKKHTCRIFIGEISK